MTSLIEIVFKNDIASLQLALAKGANPNELDADQRTPLIHAAIDDRVDAARLLVEFGADVNHQDKLGYTGLHYAAQDYHTDMVSLLLSYKADVEVEDAYGNTPLWRAAFRSRGRGDVIAALLRAGANPNHRNKNGKTPLDVARTIANYDVKQFFQKSL